MIELHITKRCAKGLLAIAVVLALALLTTHGVSHWHTHAYDEDHCQVCHIGHAPIPQSAAQVVEQAAARTPHLTLPEEFALHFDFVSAPSIPRAPPA